MNNDLISREDLKEATKIFTDCDGFNPVWKIIDNAPSVEVGYLTNCANCERVEKIRAKRPQGEFVDISKLRLMTVEECAGHTIDYAMGWKACIEWIKKGGTEE